MGKRHLGLWLIGAHGGVATTVAVGLSALRQNLCGNWGLVSELAKFSGLDLASWDRIVLGGHEIRQASAVDEARTMHEANRVFDATLLGAVADDLHGLDRRVRPGILFKSGAAIESLATPGYAKSATSPRQCIELIKADLAEFASANQFERFVVINLASTEPGTDPTAFPISWDQLDRELNDSACSLPASSLYSIAAMEMGGHRAV